ncbi:MAG TPA: Wzz/FepE/Etk N-terminal domain-containing protein, partial [Marmoricola sp.]|nr:Wzz/FepE/Etk N-terminal domain-containing protein [Marmoricola sp.]
MTVSEYLRRVFRHWRSIVTIAALFVIAVSVFSVLQKPKYQSNASVFVSNANANADIGVAMAASVYAQQKVMSYAAVASSLPMAEDVQQRLPFSASVSQIEAAISATAVYGTVIIDLTVTWPDARQAQQVLQAVI